SARCSKRRACASIATARSTSRATAGVRARDENAGGPPRRRAACGTRSATPLVAANAARLMASENVASRGVLRVIRFGSARGSAERGVGEAEEEQRGNDLLFHFGTSIAKAGNAPARCAFASALPQAQTPRFPPIARAVSHVPPRVTQHSLSRVTR